jgi:hypothetical protein
MTHPSETVSQNDDVVTKEPAPLRYIIETLTIYLNKDIKIQ